MSVGPFELLIVVAVLLLIIGPRRVTNMARSLARGLQDFAGELGKDKKEELPRKDREGDGPDR